MLKLKEKTIDKWRKAKLKKEWFKKFFIGLSFIVEYAQKAVDNSTTMVALRGKDGVVTAVDKQIPSKLYVDVRVNTFSKCFT